jgi:tetratricopeptide (TPR) repeat protein
MMRQAADIPSSVQRHMRVAVLLTAALLAGHHQPLAARQPAGTSDADRLYADRIAPASAARAAALWDEELQRNPQAFDAAWKLARACYWLGGHVAADQRRREYERGMEAGKRAVAIDAGRPEGFFWMAANMGAMAESFGLRAGLSYRGRIKDALESVLKIDPGFLQGSADRALGRWYQKVPGLFGGSDKKSLEHLQRALTYNPNSTATRYFLAETLLDLGRRDDARAELLRVIDAPVDPEWLPEDHEFKAQAAQKLKTLD